MPAALGVGKELTEGPSTLVEMARIEFDHGRDPLDIHGVPEVSLGTGQRACPPAKLGGPLEVERLVIHVGLDGPALLLERGIVHGPLERGDLGHRVEGALRIRAGAGVGQGVEQ